MEWSLVFSVSALFCAGLTAVFSVLAYAKVVGFENSTHKMEFVPVPGQQNYPENPDAQDGKTMLEQMSGITLDTKNERS